MDTPVTWGICSYPEKQVLYPFVWWIPYLYSVWCYTGGVPSNANGGTDTPLDPNATLPGEPGEPVEAPQGEKPEEEQVELETKAQEIWMDFENFCKCFK